MRLRSKTLRTRQNPDPEEMKTAFYSGYSLREGIEKTLLEIERNFAARLGNLERLQMCEKLPQFPAARHEWSAAWRMQFQQMRHGALTTATFTLPEAKRYVLEMLASSRNPKVLLQNTAGVIYVAARAGDVTFFRQMASAFRAGKRRRQHEPPLGSHLVQYWFSGLLWLMDDEAGSRALYSYLKDAPYMSRSTVQVPIHAYRQARRRLGLNGYSAFATRPPVEAYWPKQRAYKYAGGWETKLEPTMSI